MTKPTGQTELPGIGSKRPRSTDAFDHAAQKKARTHAPGSHFGQQGVFSLDDDGAGVSAEAMAYLRSVRLQAEAYTLLVAPVEVNEDTRDDNAPDSKGFYSDGAYIAAPICGPVLPPRKLEDGQGNDEEAEDSVVDAQDVHHRLLMHRFKLQRAALRQDVPKLDSAAHNEKSDSLVSGLDYRSNQSLQEQRPNIFAKPPHPVQLAQMPQKHVLHLIELLGNTITQEVVATENKDNISRLGSWAWGLLSVLGEVGTLQSEEVSVVRELARTAAQVLNVMAAIAESGMDPYDFYSMNGTTKSSDEDVDLVEDEQSQFLTGPGEVFEDEDEDEDDGNNEHLAHSSEHLTRDEHEDKSRNTVCPVQSHRRRNSSSSLSSYAYEDDEDEYQDDEDEYRDNDATVDQEEISNALEVKKTQLLASITSNQEDVNMNETDENIAVDDVNDMSEVDELALRDSKFAVLDMILRVVGECYGQQDLMEGLDYIWFEDEDDVEDTVSGQAAV